MSLLRRRAMMESHNQDIPIGANLIDIYGVFEGKSLQPDGTLANWDPGVASQYIPCDFRFKFEVKSEIDTWNRIAFYDYDKIFIPPTSSLGKYGKGIFHFGRNAAYEIPENAKYFIVMLKVNTESDDCYIIRIE